ncbi:MAG: phosphatase PAP2 family protein [Thermodesulfobacteriota bacterium]
MEWLSGLDTAIFFLINERLSSSVLDAVMPFITDKSHFIALGLIGVILILIKGKKAHKRTLILLAITVIISDFAAANLKELFGRVRPCHALEGVNLLVGCGGSYSFPSGHATNIFAAMVMLSLRHTKFMPFFLFAAAAVAYSRVYVGVHYPLDIIGGAILGTLVAFAIYWADKKGLKSIKKAIKH